MMSSNGLWKVNSQSPSMMEHIGLSSGNLSRCSPQACQDEPIDFSRKSESTAPSDSSFSHDGEIRKKFKTENGTALQNGHARNGYPNDYRGLDAIHEAYFNMINNKPRRQNGMLNGVGKTGPGLFHPPATDSSSKVENGNPSTYPAAIPSPASCPRSDVTSSRVSPQSSETDAHRANLSSRSSPETDFNLTFGRGQLSSPEAKVNSKGACNDEGVSYQQMNEHYLTKFMMPSTSSDGGPFMGGGGPFFHAGMYNARRSSFPPQLSAPILNPMNERKSNGSPPGTSTAKASLPFNAMLPHTTAYEDSMRVPNRWQLGSSYSHTSILQAQLEEKKLTKQIRPFKAYSNEIINSYHPEMRAAAMAMGSSSTLEQLLKLRSESAGRGEVVNKKGNISDPTTTSDATKFDCQSTTTNGCGETSSSPEMKGNETNESSLSSQNEEPQQQSSGNGSSRKRGNRYPENEKDNAYWERRKKNNEAAKRSRDARRRKEDALAMTAKELLEDRSRLALHFHINEDRIQKLEEELRGVKGYACRLENRCRGCITCSQNPV